MKWWNSHSREIITKEKKTNIFTIGNTIEFLTFFVGSLSFNNKFKKIYFDDYVKKELDVILHYSRGCSENKSNWLGLRRGRNQLKERKNK